jgi:UDP-N-acetylmuramyl pentapeptide phosphotransferase/UDP-N-acetylglucosamine-1-phosphate transferase
MKQIKNFILFAVITAFIFVPAQTKALGSHRENKDVQNAHTNAVPINGGLVVLLVAGAALGVKLIYDKSKKNKTTPESII